jgi:hypothetical protein
MNQVASRHSITPSMHVFPFGHVASTIAVRSRKPVCCPDRPATWTRARPRGTTLLCIGPITDGVSFPVRAATCSRPAAWPYSSGVRAESLFVDAGARLGQR